MVVVEVHAPLTLVDVQSIEHQGELSQSDIRSDFMQKLDVIFLIMVSNLGMIANDTFFANASHNTSILLESVEMIGFNILSPVAVCVMSLLEEKDSLIQVIDLEILVNHLLEILSQLLPFIEPFPQEGITVEFRQ